MNTVIYNYYFKGASDMNFSHIVIFSVILTVFLSTFALADSVPLLERKIPTRKNIITFPNDKGEVIFDHLKHSNHFKEDDCILCHRTSKPTKANVLTRFDNHRIAHYFCKGCHRETGRGPTECHECHNYKKKK